jgi:hypothetical protein
MDKSTAMAHINQEYGARLSTANTGYSNINKAKEVWWFNVAVSKFAEDVHLLLNTQEELIWVLLPKGFAKGVPFKIREDKNAVDLEISADKKNLYLKDIKSGGTYFDFKPYVKGTIVK